jgi:hypothetical protein
LSTDPQADRPRALHLLEAADALAALDPTSAPLVGVHARGEDIALLRRMADAADPMVGSLARDGFGLDEIAAMPAAPVAAPPTDRAARNERYAAAIRDTAGWVLDDGQHMIAAVIAVADAEQAELRRERDLAIAHDRQPYPTAWAYEQACKALRRKGAVVERVRQMADYWEQQLPEVIRTPAVVSALRAALEAADDPSRLAAETPEPETQGAHSCGNCEGIDPDSCLMNPRRRRNPGALDRIRSLHDSLAAETDLSGPDDLITKGSAARRIATALDGWTAPERPRRGDAFEQWLKAQRDLCFDYATTWSAVDGLLDQYRLHADTGTPLSEHVCEGQAVGDCECLETLATETPDAPRREPHPTEADLRHALAVAAKFHGQAATTPAVALPGGKADTDPRCGDTHRFEHYGIARCERPPQHVASHLGHADDGPLCEWPAVVAEPGKEG